MDTQMRSQTPVTNDKPAEMLWCIEHERMVKVETLNCGLGHLQIEETLGENSELDFCCFEGGYAFVPPPAEIADLPDDWAEQPACLSDDERAAAEVEEMGMWLGGME